MKGRIWIALPWFITVCVCLNTHAQGLNDTDKNKAVKLIRQVGCGSCHQIPEIHSANSRVGPPLQNYSKRIYIAGVLPNTHDNLVGWLLDPQEITPGTAMPDSDLTQAQAHLIASYLLGD